MEGRIELAAKIIDYVLRIAGVAFLGVVAFFIAWWWL